MPKNCISKLENPLPSAGGPLSLKYEINIVELGEKFYIGFFNSDKGEKTPYLYDSNRNWISKDNLVNKIIDICKYAPEMVNSNKEIFNRIILGDYKTALMTVNEKCPDLLDKHKELFCYAGKEETYNSKTMLDFYENAEPEIRSNAIQKHAKNFVNRFGNLIGGETEIVDRLNRRVLQCGVISKGGTAGGSYYRYDKRLELSSLEEYKKASPYALTHELNHGLSNPDEEREKENSVENYCEWDRGIDEGATEWISAQMDRISAESYLYNVKMFSFAKDIVGEDVAVRSYANNTNEMQKAFDKVMGVGAYERFSKPLDQTHQFDLSRKERKAQNQIEKRAVKDLMVQTRERIKEIDDPAMVKIIQNALDKKKRFFISHSPINAVKAMLASRKAYNKLGIDSVAKNCGKIDGGGAEPIDERVSAREMQRKAHNMGQRVEPNIPEIAAKKSVRF